MIGCHFGRFFQVTVAGGSYQEGLVSVIQGIPAGMAITEPRSTPKPSSEVDPGDAGIAGRFRVTPTGEIVLAPKFNDIRAIAGLSGDFEITANGEIYFRPDADTAGPTNETH